MVEVDEVVIHEKYDSDLKLNDIALMRLSQAVDMRIYTPVCLPSPGETYVGLTGWVYGAPFFLIKGQKNPNSIFGRLGSLI